jgi:hypothetical protein
MSDQHACPFPGYDLGNVFAKVHGAVGHDEGPSREWPGVEYSPLLSGKRVPRRHLHRSIIRIPEDAYRIFTLLHRLQSVM